MPFLKILFLTLFVSVTTVGFAQSGGGILSVPSPIDTLRNSVDRDIQDAQGRLNNIRSRVTRKIDSLRSVSNPNKFLLARLDSINSGLDSLQKGISEKIGSSLDGVKKAEEKIDKKMDVVEKGLNDKVGLFSKNGANVGNVSLDLPRINMPNDLGLARKVDGSNLSIADKLKTPDMKVPELSVKNLPTKIGDIPSLDKVEALKGKTGEITKVTGKIGEVSDKVGSINVNDPGQIEKQVESKVTSMNEFKDLEASTLPMKDYAEISKQLHEDPHMARELALNKAKEGAVNHFAGHAKELKAGMDQLSAMKKKYKAMGNTVDMFRRPSDPMREKPFIERLYPGIDLQVRATENTWIIFTPSFAYRLRLRWTLGIGWNERISMNFKNRRWISEEHAFGPQAYVEYMIKRNLAVRAETDYVNAFLPSDAGRAWRWSYYVGVRKMFNVSKRVIGSVQLLYSLDHIDKHFFDTQRLTIRTGIQFRLKKQRK